MTPENRTTLNYLIALAETPLPLDDFSRLASELNLRFEIHSALTSPMLLGSHIDPQLTQSLRRLKDAFDAGEFEGDDPASYRAAVATLASQVTRENRIALGVLVEPLIPHL